MRFLERLPSWIFAVFGLVLAIAAGRAATRPGIGPAHAPALGGGLEVLGVPIAFVLFGLVLSGVALFEKRAMRVAAVGLATILTYTAVFVPEFGVAAHARAEWVTLVNLLLLLVGFALLAHHVERSRLPEALPAILPDGWTGGLVLLAIVAVLSAFLDNIAAALIGGTIARVVFRHRVHVGFLAGIVAAANAGGAGSVVGDTTTTMMWIDGVSPAWVLHAYVASAAAFVVFATIAARQQHAYQPVLKDAPAGLRVDRGRLVVVAVILAAAIGANVVVNVTVPRAANTFPFIGVAVWIAILTLTPFRRPEWRVVPGALRGSVFLLSLVMCASLMPVRSLPDAAPHTAFGLGILSAVFDNIPLTSLCLRQGGYDWGVLAYAVGFGGSMIWFGSSAGVALTSDFPEARSVRAWIKGGWHVVLAYVLGFGMLLAWPGWQPHPPHGFSPAAAVTAPASGDSR